MLTLRTFDIAGFTVFAVLASVLYCLALLLAVPMVFFFVVFALNLQPPRVFLTLVVSAPCAIAVASAARSFLYKRDVAATIAVTVLVTGALLLAVLTSLGSRDVKDMLGIEGAIVAGLAPAIASAFFPNSPPNTSLERTREK